MTSGLVKARGLSLSKFRHRYAFKRQSRRFRLMARVQGILKNIIDFLLFASFVRRIIRPRLEHCRNTDEGRNNSESGVTTMEASEPTKGSDRQTQ